MSNQQVMDVNPNKTQKKKNISMHSGKYSDYTYDNQTSKHDQLQIVSKSLANKETKHKNYSLEPHHKNGINDLTADYNNKSNVK